MVESMGGEWSGASAKFYGREKVGNSMRASGVSNIYVEVYHHYYLFICVFYIMLCVGVTNHMDVYSLCIQTNTWPAGGAGRREKSRLQYIHLDKWEILGGARAREIAIIAWARARARARARAIIISLI